MVTVPPRSLSRFVLLAATASAVVACDDHTSFSTGPDEAYCGAVTLSASFREGLSPRVQLRLRLDAGALGDASRSPGVLSTYEAAGGGGGARRLLDEAPLRPLGAVAHDTLSQLELGEEREGNYLYAVSPADDSAESILAIVSLRSDDRVEVRLLRPGVAPPPGGTEVPDGRRPVFGLFVLDKKSGACGF